MSQRVEFSFSVLSYVHAPGMGESINIGVFACCPDQEFADVMFDSHVEFLGRVFSGFQIDEVRFAIHDFRRRLQHHLRRFHRQISHPVLLSVQDLKEAGVRSLFNAEEFLHQIWADGGLSLQYSDVRFGITNNARRELEELFELYVGRQRVKFAGRKQVRKTETDIWNEFAHLLPRPARTLIQSHTISTANIDVTFNYTYKNGHYTAFQPLTVDYQDAELAQMRAVRWLGVGYALSHSEDLNCIYFLLGDPDEGSDAQKKTFSKVQNLLNQIPIRKEFVREQELGSLAHSTVSYMRKNGDLQGVLN